MLGIQKSAMVFRKVVSSRGSRDGMWFGGEGDSDGGGIILTEHILSYCARVFLT